MYVPPDTGYILEVSYYGRIEKMYHILIAESKRIDFQLEVPNYMDAIVVNSHPRKIKEDSSTFGKTINSEQIERLGARNINNIASTVSGAPKNNGSCSISTRTDGTVIYLDGVRVKGNPPQTKSKKCIFNKKCKKKSN